MQAHSRIRLLTVAVAALLAVRPSVAQTTGDCPPAEAEAFLDINNVRAAVYGNGPLFWRGGGALYEVPKGDGVQALFAFSLWVGGTVNGELRVAAARYGNYEFWPGPLDANGDPPPDCKQYDRIWEITRDDLVLYDETGVPPVNLRDWPWDLDAPVVDGDGDPENYNLEGGDRPALVGDQMLWWIMNDAAGEHESSGSEPLVVEVRGTAFSYRHSNSVLDNTTFYRYVVTNKGKQPIENAWIGFLADNDMGSAQDDYVASDTMLHLGYTYNADEDDDGSDAYGISPPAVGFTILKGPFAESDGRDNNRDGDIDEIGERHGMATFACFFKGGGPWDEPRTADGYYNCLRGRWPNGEPITVGGNGTNEFGSGDNPGPTTHFLFPGDPTTGDFWTMENVDGLGNPLTPFDTRFSLSSGPFEMQPGGTQEFAFAVVWARGDHRLDSARRLKLVAAAIQRGAADFLQPDVSTSAADTIPPASPLGFAENYPNPFSTSTTIRYGLSQEVHVRLSVYDVLGREVTTLVDRVQGAGFYDVTFEPGDLPGGVYIYRIEVDQLSATQTMLLVR